jgi:polar amino acid transport system substrate-binding protein
MSLFRFFCGVAAFAVFAVSPVQARTLDEVKQRRALSMCAHPDALPYASEKGDLPGIQVELGRKIAEALGVSLNTEWIVARRRASQVNCDLLFDTINRPEVHEGKLLLSRPYQKSGVALGLRADAAPVDSYYDLKSGQKVGVMVSSLTSVLLGKRGLTTSPYAFEQDMIEDLVKGELYAATVSPAKLAWYIQQHPDSRLRLVHAYEHEPELAWTVSVGLRKADQALLDEVNAILDRLLTDGTIGRIYARYGVEHRQP